MATLLLLSPHLDDAVFSVGAYAADRAREGDAVVAATVFTASVPNPTGFALRCQTDKGYGPAVDYMALRRAEDVAACGMLGIQAEHWGFCEAPHRGYERPAALFAGVREGAGEEHVVAAIADRLRAWLAAHADTLEVAYPIGAGNHVDHLLVIRAAREVRAERPDLRWWQWYDQPYTARAGATAEGTLVPVTAAMLARKWSACAAYASQARYQFYEALGENAPAVLEPGDLERRIARVLGQVESRGT